MIRLGYAIHARSRALAYICKQTWALLPLGCLVDPRAAGPDRVDLQKRVESLSDSPALGVGAEVAHLLELSISSDEGTWNVIAHRDCQVWIALVVAEPHVEGRVKLFDPLELELECVVFGVDNCPLHVTSAEQHALGALVQFI